MSTELTIPDFVAKLRPWWVVYDKLGNWWCVVPRFGAWKNSPFKWEIAVVRYGHNPTYYPFAEYEDVMTALDINTEMYGDEEFVH